MQREVRLEALFTGSPWTDLSDRLKVGGSVSVSRGRDSETGDPLSVGTLGFVLANGDGAFSPEFPGSPYYPYVVPGVPVRLSVRVAGVWRVRGYGSVQTWGVSPLSWSVADCAVTATDSLGAFPDYTFRSAANEVVRRTSGIRYHWPLQGSDFPQWSKVGNASMAAVGSPDSDGVLLAMDEGDPHQKVKSASGGLKLTTSLAAVKSTMWRLRFVLMAAPTASCTLVSMACKVFGSASLTPVSFASGAVSWMGLSVTPSAYPAVVEIGPGSNVGPSGGDLWLRCCSVDGVVSSSSTVTSLLGAPTALTVNPTLSGNAVWSIAHLALLSGASSSSDLSAFAKLLLGDRSPSSDSAVSMVCGFAGGLTISGQSAGDTGFPLMEGRDAGDVLAALATGMGARIVDDLDGTLTWLPFMRSGALVALPSAGAPPWNTDISGWLSDCEVDWPDGTTTTVTRPDGPRKSTSVEGVHPSRAADRDYAQWLVWSPTRARMPQLVYNLSAMSDADVVTLMGVTVGSRVTQATLPAWMPSPQTCIVEGVEESISNDAWMLTLKLSPDEWTRQLIVGDATYGVVGRQAAGFGGPATSPTGDDWKSGQQVDAATLNTRQYAGPALLSGDASIAPTAANTPTSATVTFATAFATVPTVVACPATGALGSGVTGVSVSGVTTTGCTIWGTSNNVTGFTVSWLAVA